MFTQELQTQMPKNTEKEWILSPSSLFFLQSAQSEHTVEIIFACIHVISPKLLTLISNLILRVYTESNNTAHSIWSVPAKHNPCLTWKSNRIALKTDNFTKLKYVTKSTDSSITFILNILDMAKRNYGNDGDGERHYKWGAETTVNMG